MSGFLVQKSSVARSETSRVSVQIMRALVQVMAWISWRIDMEFQALGHAGHAALATCIVPVLNAYDVVLFEY